MILVCLIRFLLGVRYRSQYFVLFFYIYFIVLRGRCFFQVYLVNKVIGVCSSEVFCLRLYILRSRVSFRVCSSVSFSFVVMGIILFVFRLGGLNVWKSLFSVEYLGKFSKQVFFVFSFLVILKLLFFFLFGQVLFLVLMDFCLK